MILQTGELFRRFRVLGNAGQGGMGVVYRAHDVKLGRDVALKFVTQVGDYDRELHERLRREARSLAALSHPNIVTIHDIDEVNNAPFLVLEWINGKPLNEALFSRPLSTGDFQRIALPVAEALGSAHDQGIVHRDLKPSNVLVSNEGHIKVVDFGLAKFRDFDRDVILTAGTVGTIAYMSPEQASGGELGPASDVFSFGIVAYELLTGERPFKGDGLGAVLSAIMNGSHRALREVRSDLPEQLFAVVERCLEVDPVRRFQNGRELANALRQIAASSSFDAPTKIIATAPRTSAKQQDIQFCTTSDGVHLAYSVIGNGPLLVRVLGHFTHLEMEWEWPDLRHFWEQLAARFTVVRYDGRGTGLSDNYAGEFTEDTRQIDLDAVLKAVGAEKAILLGISEGGWTAATYALHHPEQITHLVLYGAYCRGARARPGYDAEEDEALVTLIRKGWGRDTPRFRQVFTSLFFQPDADPKLIAHFNEIQRASADPETAARYHESCHARGDGQELFRQLRLPTLVVHCRDDMAVSADEGRLLASLIPGAHLVLLPSHTHYFPTDREVVSKVVGAISRFIDGAEH
ncbi:MAG TPA: alpha/beta fold hydrolase [Pyrinomonadaceae bacterium]|nr:alpha/beta fold hydrolase [Pyrinomonadaceae bacterium]